VRPTGGRPHQTRPLGYDDVDQREVHCCSLVDRYWPQRARHREVICCELPVGPRAGIIQFEPASAPMQVPGASSTNLQPHALGHDWDDQDVLSDVERPTRPFKAKLVPLVCVVCGVATVVGLAVAVGMVVTLPSRADLNAFVRGTSAMANDDDAAETSSAADSTWQSCATTTGAALQSLRACDAEPWCAQLHQTAEISHAEIVAFSSESTQLQPLMLNALDYRYFESCHITNSINLWGALLYCELRAAEQAHRQDRAAGGDIVQAHDDLVKLEKATRGRALHGPLHNLTSALARQRPVIFYCANPS
jgi:hypothetical protein